MTPSSKDVSTDSTCPSDPTGIDVVRSTLAPVDSPTIILPLPLLNTVPSALPAPPPITTFSSVKPPTPVPPFTASNTPFTLLSKPPNCILPHST